MIPCVTYLRVSTEEQTVENQRAYLEDWAARHGFHIVRHYAEHAVSGYTSVLKRLEFRRLVRDVEGGRLSPRPVALLVFEVSRLVRNFAEFFRLLDLVEGRLGLFIVSASEKESALQSLDGTYRQFLRTVLAFVANMEREFIRQRTRAALERARREGRVSNVADRIGPEVAAAIVEEWRRGGSLRSIARSGGLSLYEVRRVLAKYGGYRPSGQTCPRCFSRMRVVDRALKHENGSYVLQVRMYCHNCGYEETGTGGRAP